MKHKFNRAHITKILSTKSLYDTCIISFPKYKWSCKEKFVYVKVWTHVARMSLNLGDQACTALRGYFPNWLLSPVNIPPQLRIGNDYVKISFKPSIHTLSVQNNLCPTWEYPPRMLRSLFIISSAFFRSFLWGTMQLTNLIHTLI